MQVPNFVPEPLEIPGNVTLERYRVRLRFIKGVGWRHALTVAVVAFMAAAPWPTEYAGALGKLMLGGLVVLEMVRIRFRGRNVDSYVTSAIFLPFLVVLGGFLRTLNDLGYGTWGLAIPPVFLTLYSLASGRDFSFVGCGMLSGIASAVTIAALSLTLHQPAGWPLGLAMAALVFLVYDWASLLSRRRVGEEWAAAMDLYRDVLNVFGYVPRVLRHWKKHMIWGESPFVRK